MAFLSERAYRESTRADPAFDEYVLCLEETDELVAAIIAAASINPAVLLMRLPPEAVEWYRCGSLHRLAQVGPRPGPKQ